MQDFASFIPELLAVHINLPATFQFSPATSKSIDKMLPTKFHFIWPRGFIGED
jgi:hypothetical protein